jgi:hypothetical protein
MIRPAALLLPAVIVIAAGIAAGTAAQDPTISILVRAGGQNGPVQIVGLKRPEKQGHDPLVHFRNTSSKKTARIWVEAIISGRDGKVVRISSNSSNQLRPAERSVPPGGEGWAREPVLQSSRLVTAGKDLHSNCLQVTVLVSSVDFDDGTSWNRDQGKNGISWTLPTRLGGEDSCKNSTATDAEVGQITGAGIRSLHVDKPADHGEVDSYSFSCALTPKQGGEGLVATCSF